LSGLGGVQTAGLANMAVLTGNEWDNSVTVEGYQARPGEEMGPHFNAVSPGYFEAMGIHILAGRDFTVKDGFGAPLVAVVNARFAKRFFGDKVAVGRHFGRGSDPGTPTNIEIIGVVNDTRYESLRDPIPEQVFVSFAQNSNNAAWAYVRTIRDPDSAFRAVRAAIREMEPNLPLLNMKTLDTQLDESLVTERMIATLSSVFGALATLLALVGLYGVMAYMVTRRAREIGIRMALGARAASVVWLVMREVLVVVGAGVALGVPAALALSRLVESQLYGIQPNDPASIALATLLLAGVASLAGYLPARRAAASDPVRALRTE
jgi:predicted permease